MVYHNLHDFCAKSPDHSYFLHIGISIRQSGFFYKVTLYLRYEDLL